jgi:hypothetical protein
MTTSSLFTRLTLRRLISVIAVSIVAGSVLFSGVIRHGGVKDVDARYFYAAAKCWAAGKSPYETAVYNATFYASFDSYPEATVAYLPTLMLLVLPMAPFDWPRAATLFSLMNFGAAMVLFWACCRIVRELVGSPLRLTHWLWIVLACTIGGIAGTIFTGQTSVFVTAACALAVLGCRIQRTLLTVIGLVVASAKPHLSGPLLLFIFLFEPRQRGAVAIAAACIVAFVGYAAMVDSNLFHSFIDSVSTYKTFSANDPAKQIGAVPLLLYFGISLKVGQWLGALSLITVLGLAMLLLKYCRCSLTQSPYALILLVFSIGIAQPIHQYDLCCYAIGVALLATLDFRYQCALLPPTLIIWRPELLNGLLVTLPVNQSATLAWLSLLVGSVIIAILRLRSKQLVGASPLAAESISASNMVRTEASNF